MPIPRSRPALVTTLLAAAATVASFGAAGASPGAGELTVAISFTEEVDPDVFFDLELVSLTNAVYEGLVRYAPGGTEVEGVLAESWEVSPDGLTFTFHLRPEATFADGSPVDSAAVLAAFERKAAMQGPPSYILAEVAGYEAPDPATFVITLSTPVNNFMERLASPAGSLITNATVVAEHASGDDLAGGWLGTHSAGSGPYVIGEFVPDDRIVMERNENYWGAAPPFDQVIFRVIPDVTSQQLQVEQGDVDLVANLGPQAATQMAGDDSVVVDSVQGLNQAFIQVNITKPPFDDPAVAQAFAASIDREQIVADVWGDYATVSDQLAPAGIMPEGTATFTPEFDPDAFAAATAELDKPEPIVINQAEPDAQNTSTRVNEYLAEILRDAGYEVVLEPHQVADYFGFIGNPDITPNLVFSVQPGDGAAPANWFDLFMTTYGALNVGGTGSPDSDALMVAGNSPPAGEEPDYESYSAASDLIRDQGGFIPIADVATVFVHQPELANVQMHVTLPPAFWIADLTPSEDQ